MTKNSRIFKSISRYFRLHPIGVLSWIWVTLIPPLGSLLFIWNYSILDEMALDSIFSILLFIILTAFMMGLALLPTSFIAVTSGYFFGWIALPCLIFSYSFASILGYRIGQQTNSSLLDILFVNHPTLKNELDVRKSKERDLIFFVRLSPIIPFAISNFLFATMRVSLRKVVVFGILGMLPRTLVVFFTGVFAQTFINAQNALTSPLQWIIGVVLLVIGGVGIYFSWIKKPI